MCVLAYTSTAEPWLVPGSAATYYRVSEVMSSGQTCHPSDLPLSQVISAASGLRRPPPDPLEGPEVRSVALMQRTASSSLCLSRRSVFCRALLILRYGRFPFLSDFQSLVHEAHLSHPPSLLNTFFVVVGFAHSHIFPCSVITPASLCFSICRIRSVKRRTIQPALY